MNMIRNICYDEHFATYIVVAVSLGKHDVSHVDNKLTLAMNCK